jgi:hypothetical protein
MKAQQYLNYRTFKLIRHLFSTGLAVVSLSMVVRAALGWVL